MMSAKLLDKMAVVDGRISTLWKMQDGAQELVRALFPDIESNGCAKYLSGKLFQRKVINYDCLHEIGQVDCDRKASTVLAKNLYEDGTEKSLKNFADVLKESGLPRQIVLGEWIEVALEALEPVDMEVN